MLHGGLGAKQRREITERLVAISPGEERVLVATGRYLGEGFDDARLDTLFLALPVSWRGTLVQYAGRLHRLDEGKTEVRIYDYADLGVPVLARMYERRLRGYRAMGYEVS
ncbi:MAG: DEAD/DEAH box helicase [Thermoleophilia bacterium]